MLFLCAGSFSNWSISPDTKLPGGSLNQSLLKWTQVFKSPSKSQHWPYDLCSALRRLGSVTR